jgi:glycosyltransferase involved in cell wall biosynthesis
MQILISYPSFYLTDKGYDVGGESLFAWEIIRRVAERGHTVHVIGPYIDLSRVYENIILYQPKNCDYLRQQNRMKRRLYYYRYNRKVRAVAKKVLQKNSIDVVHHMYPSYPGAYSTVFDLAENFVYGPMAVQYDKQHEAARRSPFHAPVERLREMKRRRWLRGLYRAKKIFVAADYAKRQIPEELWPKTEKVWKGVDETFFRITGNGSSDGTKRVLYLTHVRKNKGAHILLQAIPEIVKQVPDIEFTFVGRNYDREYFDRLVEDLGVKRYVRFTGLVERKELPGYFGAADLYCFPALQDSAPFSLFEAMASGLPVIATYAKSIPEFLEHGKNGYLVEPGNVGELADAIVELVRDEEKMREFGSFNREQARQRFDWERCADTVERAYAELAQRRR